MNSNKSPEAVSSHSPGCSVSPNLDYTNEPHLSHIHIHTPNTNAQKCFYYKGLLKHTPPKDNLNVSSVFVILASEIFDGVLFVVLTTGLQIFGNLTTI